MDLPRKDHAVSLFFLRAQYPQGRSTSRSKNPGFPSSSTHKSLSPLKLKHYQDLHHPHAQQDLTPSSERLGMTPSCRQRSRSNRETEESITQPRPPVTSWSYKDKKQITSLRFSVLLQEKKRSSGSPSPSFHCTLLQHSECLRISPCFYQNLLLSAPTWWVPLFNQSYPY